MEIESRGVNYHYKEETRKRRYLYRNSPDTGMVNTFKVLNF